MPQVSVVIPVFNCAHLIDKALSSVFTQTFQDFEVILVDDGSDDQQALRDAVAPWSDRIQYIRQRNGGPAAARNTGISRAIGPLVAFLDADDEWMPEKLRRQVDYFERYPETGLLHAGVVGTGQQGGASTRPPRLAFCDLFHTSFFVQTVTVMVPRRVLQEVGGFDERREIHIEDWDLWLRIAARHPFGYLDEPLAIHRPGGWMSSQVERTYAAQALVIEKNRSLCQQACAMHRANPQDCYRRRLYVLHRDWGDDRFYAGNRRGARTLLAKALRHAPLDLRTAALYLATFIPERLRAFTRRPRHALTARTRPSQATERSATAKPAASVPSLVHDTLYRRARRRVLAHVHGIDDIVWRACRRRRRVLFDASSPMSFTIFRPMYERLRLDPRLELWFTAHGRVWQPQDVYGPAGITENVIPAAAAAWMKVDLYINADFWDMTWLHRRTRRMHLFHGVAGKYTLDTPFELAPMIAAFDCLMFPNADRRRRYIDAALVPDDDLKAALVGFPKVDRLVDGSLDGPAVARSLGFDPATPTVIYAPTWSPYSSLKNLGEDVIERLAAEGLQVIVKLHDRSYDTRQRGSGGVDWVERLSKYDRHPRVRVVRDADSSPYLAASDLLVSDHSSIAFEFMLLDRPIVVIDQPDLVRMAGINPEKVRLLRSAALVVNDTGGIADAVFEGLRDPGRFSDVRRKIAGELFYRAGSATDRAVALIYRLIDLPAFAASRTAAEPVRALTVG